MVISCVFLELFAEELFSQMSISSSDQKSIKIKYMKTLPSDGISIYSVTWHGKDIVCGTDNGILTLNEHSQKKQVNIRGHVQCIRRIDRYAFAILYDNGNTEREVRISCNLFPLAKALTKKARIKWSDMKKLYKNKYLNPEVKSIKFAYSEQNPEIKKAKEAMERIHDSLLKERE